MNFEFMPELKWEHGYAFVIALMILIELGIFWLLKRRGWIRNRRR
jgi:magnesium transporter